MSNPRLAPSILDEYVQYALVQGFKWVLILLLLFLLLLLLSDFFWLRYLRSCIGLNIHALSGSYLLLEPRRFVLVRTGFPWLFPTDFMGQLLLRLRFRSLLLITDSYCCRPFFPRSTAITPVHIVRTIVAFLVDHPQAFQSSFGQLPGGI